MSESTLTAKGQTTMPQPIRDALHAQPGSKLVWNLMPNGTVIVRAKSQSILDMAGKLKAPRGKSVHVADMNAWR
ncbi:AbrB/MazE/SpoVT family DNA-binding domain-containing protein [Polaromonas sp.]|uniref:AbrB/MazE/SpoVT family DNA-binding domain-containing protein n=1 Tax=Polaromonas sp. TaxID=1869339 RepID=UPI002FCBAB38